MPYIGPGPGLGPVPAGPAWESGDGTLGPGPGSLPGPGLPCKVYAFGYVNDRPAPRETPISFLLDNLTETNSGTTGEGILEEASWRRHILGPWCLHDASSMMPPPWGHIYIYIAHRNSYPNK